MVYTMACIRLSQEAAFRQVALWRTWLPWVRPHYAVKCNDTPELLTWFRESGLGFDCASSGEMRSVLAAGGIPESILYANPCKSPQDLDYAQQTGVPNTVVDCVEEVRKLAGWKGGVLVRLAVPDAHSRHRFSTKFGATLEECPAIFRTILECGLAFEGLSFHVGSECMNPKQFSTAVKVCGDAERIGGRLGLHVRIVDIGGGFMSDEGTFSAAAKEMAGVRDYFPSAEWISEPGRFFAAPTMSLRVPVIGVRRTSKGVAYTLDESVYSMFSCIPFDGQKPVFRTAKKGVLEQCTLFGHTCDSADILGVTSLPALEVGDILDVADMGAYTLVSASTFNGFSRPRVELV